MLNAIFSCCREIGLDKILITCIDGNIGSEKTMLNNGGFMNLLCMKQAKTAASRDSG